jgi:hypothetical protein
LDGIQRGSPRAQIVSCADRCHDGRVTKSNGDSLKVERRASVVFSSLQDRTWHLPSRSPTRIPGKPSFENQTSPQEVFSKRDLSRTSCRLRDPVALCCVSLQCQCLCSRVRYYDLLCTSILLRASFPKKGGLTTGLTRAAGASRGASLPLGSISRIPMPEEQMAIVNSQYSMSPGFETASQSPHLRSCSAMPMYLEAISSKNLAQGSGMSARALACRQLYLLGFSPACRYPLLPLPDHVLESVGDFVLDANVLFGTGFAQKGCLARQTVL